MGQCVRFWRSLPVIAAVSLVAQCIVLAPIGSMAADVESSIELRYGLDRVKVKGFDIPFFGGGPDEDKVRTTVFKKQSALLDKADKRRPSVDDYLIALNVQLLYLHRFNEYKKNWLEKFPHQDDPRAVIAAKSYVNKIFRDECLKTVHFAEDLQDMLGFEFYSRVIKLNPYAQVLPIAVKQVNEYKDYETSEPERQTLSELGVYKDSVSVGVQQLWKTADENGQIPELKKRTARSIPFIDVEVFKDGTIKSQTHVTSGSSKLDQEAIDCANKYHPPAFPSSIQSEVSVHVIVRMPFRPSRHIGIKEVSRKELEQHHQEQREIQERDMEVKRMNQGRNAEKVVPWKNLIPYGDVQPRY